MGAEHNLSNQESGSSSSIRQDLLTNFNYLPPLLEKILGPEDIYPHSGEHAPKSLPDFDQLNYRPSEEPLEQYADNLRHLFFRYISEKDFALPEGVGIRPGSAGNEWVVTYTFGNTPIRQESILIGKGLDLSGKEVTLTHTQQRSEFFYFTNHSTGLVWCLEMVMDDQRQVIQQLCYPGNHYNHDPDRRFVNAYLAWEAGGVGSYPFPTLTYRSDGKDWQGTSYAHWQVWQVLATNQDKKYEVEPVVHLARYKEYDEVGDLHEGKIEYDYNQQVLRVYQTQSFIEGHSQVSSARYFAEELDIEALCLSDIKSNFTHPPVNQARLINRYQIDTDSDNQVTQVRSWLWDHRLNKETSFPVRTVSKTEQVAALSQFLEETIAPDVLEEVLPLSRMRGLLGETIEQSTEYVTSFYWLIQDYLGDYPSYAFSIRLPPVDPLERRRLFFFLDSNYELLGKSIPLQQPIRYLPRVKRPILGHEAFMMTRPE